MFTNVQWLLLILALVVAVAWYVVTQNKRKVANSKGNTPVKVAFICLTRGYTDMALYDSLIERNKALSVITQNLQNTNGYAVDNLIFHEGNIPADHQAHIQQATPDWKISFIDVHSGGTGRAFDDANAVNVKNTPVIYSTKTSDFFPAGYKHMCHFWFIDFVHYVKEYNYAVRVDEDCIMTNFPIRLLNKIRKNNYVFVTPTYDKPDVPDVTVGLQTTVSEFMKENGLVEKFKLKEYQKTPYTNVCIVDVGYFLNSSIYFKFTDYIHNTNGIYINRWGDLPLWSYFLANMVPEEKYIRARSLKYYHGSHGRLVN